jgi:hypothetical protein
MYLEDLSELISINPDIKKEEIKSISQKKIYYLISGRNAWHSTWVEHYSKKSISTDSRELEKDAEKRREAGTSFCIEELPVLCFDLDSGCFLLTEINTDYPLKKYTPREFLIKNNQCNYIKTLNCHTEQSFIGNNLSVILKSLNTKSCWEQSHPKESLFLLFLKNKSSSELDEKSSYYLRRNSSTSGGKKNSLSWVITTGKVSDEYISKLVNL